MQTRLRTLRSQLASLRWRRQAFRWATAFSAFFIALLWILAGVFLLDFLFPHMTILQRVVLIAVGLGALVWATLKYTRPFLGVDESEVEMALLVERQHGIDSDLVAALQFESPEASRWGSPELENAVIDYVAQLDRGLDVFKGLSHEQLWRRLGILTATVAVAAAFVALAPGHAYVFLNRLALGNMHYPSDTAIERVLVNGTEVLDRPQHGTAPGDVKSAQGQPVVFAVWANTKGAAGADDTNARKTADAPDEGAAHIFSAGPAGVRKVKLAAVGREELEDARRILAGETEPHSGGRPPASESNRSEQQHENLAKLLAATTLTNVSKLSEALRNPAADSRLLTDISNRIALLLERWPSDDDRLYVGKLPRLSDEVRFKLYLGDAWTDPATIHLIPLPVVVPNFNDILPAYARSEDDDESQQNDPTSLQRSVIEGSRVELTLDSTKPLVEAKLTVLDTPGGNGPAEFPLQPLDDARLRWALEGDNTPLADVRGPVRFEIQVTDEDGLSLESPLRGYIRLKADRPPRIAGSLVHRVLLPTARPEVELRASDDFGIAALGVHVEVTRREREPTGDEANEATFDIDQLLPRRGSLSPNEAASRPVRQLEFPLSQDSLPLVGAYVLDISSLGLDRGDEVRITLRATDYRGELEGVTAESEPIVLEITDESGILAAVSEGDRRSQEQIDDLIRRQLGIGEAP